MSDFKLTHIGECITVEQDVDRKAALAILTRVLSGNDIESENGQIEQQNRSRAPKQIEYDEATVGSMTVVTASDSMQAFSEKPLSLREFINTHEPKTNAQFILCIAEFMAKNENSERFSREVIKHRFPTAGEPIPKNFSRDFQTSIDKGWIGEDPSKRGEFYVTRTGERQLKDGFKGKRN
ncbi:MAG: hypothetical protein AB3N13_05060 [Arenibacterium sp.]